MHEPMTAGTDFLLALLGVGFAWGLRQSGPPVSLGKRLWAWGLAAHGIGALLGGFYHGFGPDFSPSAASGLWHAVLLELSVGTGLLVAGLAFAALGRVGSRLVAGVMVGKVAAYGVWISSRADFFPALCDQGIALLCLAVLAWGCRGAAPLRFWITGGVLLTLVGDGVQALGVAPASGFNQNDLYHLIEAAALACYYRAGCRIGIGPPPTIRASRRR